jgi:hypothetical protein
MWTTKQTILFWAGFELFHALSHVVIAILGDTPVRYFKLSEKWNTAAIVVNGVICIALIVWASRL